MKNKRKYVILKILSIISLILSVIFGVFLNKLGMIPLRYLLTIYLIFFIIYLISLFFVFKKKIKRKFKIIFTVILIIIAVISSIGINYLSKTINFFDTISSDMKQQEIYYLMVLNSSDYNEVQDLENKTIGIYKSKNTDEVELELQKKLTYESKIYNNISELVLDTNNKTVDAIVINSVIKDMIDDDNLEFKDELRELDRIIVYVENNDSKKEVDVTNSVFNLYIAGGDSYGSIDKVTNTDVNMIATIDPVNRKILLTSIPRDYYVKLPSFGENAYDKLTHAGYYGIEESIGAIENLLNIDINYYLKVNFSTVEKLVDAIGGVDVYSDFDFYERAFHQYHFTKGNNHLTGKQALAFSRERESFIDGDVQRVKNQQKVISAVIDKFTSSTTLITNFSKILDSVSESFITNLDTSDINKLVKMQINDMRNWNIETQNLTGISDYSTNVYSLPGLNLYIMRQDKESVYNAKLKINDYLVNNH